MASVAIPAAAKMTIAGMNLRIALSSLVLDSLEGSSASALVEEYHVAGGAGDHSTLRPANSTTFFHLSVSALIISPKPSGEAISGAPPYLQVLEKNLGRVVTSITPGEIVAKLNGEINAILTEADLSQRLVELGGAPLIATPEQFGEMIKAETDKWKKVVEFAGLKVE